MFVIIVLASIVPLIFNNSMWSVFSR